MVMIQKLVTKARGCCKHLCVLGSPLPSPLHVKWLLRYILVKFLPLLYILPNILCIDLEGEREEGTEIMILGYLQWRKGEKAFRRIIRLGSKYNQLSVWGYKETPGWECPSDNNFKLLITSIFCGIWILFSAWYNLLFKEFNNFKKIFKASDVS